MAKKSPFESSMVKLRVPEDMGKSVSVAGFTLEVEDDRTVVVPAAEAQKLIDHGLKVVEKDAA